MSRVTPFLIDGYFQHHAKQLSQKVAECRAEYERNRCSDIELVCSLCDVGFFVFRCDPEQRVPALEHLCNDWALCIEAGASGSMQTAALSAEILGQVINTFLEQLTWSVKGKGEVIHFQ